MENDKTIKITNTNQAKAFVWFLAKEISRHARDMSEAWDDIERVCSRWCIPVPDLPDPEIWVDAK